MIKVIFFGTPEIACPTLLALTTSPLIEVIAVVSQPDKPRGRDLQLQSPPVKSLAQNRGIPVFQPAKARDPLFIEKLRQLQPDLMVVIAYGQILPQSILDIPHHGCLNIHTSLLPRHRGAAPIQWSILSGDAETGVTIMKMDAGLDTGPILSQKFIPIRPEDNSQTIHDQLAEAGADLLLETIPEYVQGKINPRPQPEGETYARKISKEDGLIDWTLPAITIWNKVRAFTPWPGAFTFLPREGRKQLLKIWIAVPEGELPLPPGMVASADKSGLVVACGGGSLRIQRLQREGGRQINAQDFLSGNPLKPGTFLG